MAVVVRKEADRLRTVQGLQTLDKVRHGVVRQLAGDAMRSGEADQMRRGAHRQDRPALGDGAHIGRGLSPAVRAGRYGRWGRQVDLRPGPGFSNSPRSTQGKRSIRIGRTKEKMRTGFAARRTCGGSRGLQDATTAGRSPTCRRRKPTSRFYNTAEGRAGVVQVMAFWTRRRFVRPKIHRGDGLKQS